MINNDLFGGGVVLRPPQDLPRLYRSGEIIGAYLAEADNLPSHIRSFARYQRDQARAELPAFNFETAPKRGNWKAGAYKNNRALLWKAWLALDPVKGLSGAQLTGDCVSWGERCKQEVRRCVEILTLGEREGYVKRQATCLLYSGRGHTGEGASPLGIANWATKCGILLEDVFVDANGKRWDFTDYQSYVNLGIQYGRTGLPASITSITSKNRVISQSNVRTKEASADLLFNGYSVSLGFSLDTANVGNPVSKLSGRTAHETCVVGYDDTDLAHAICKRCLGYEDMLFFYDQSWGPWNRITELPEEWKPWGQGMYIHSGRDHQRHLDEQEATACGGSIVGFQATPLDNLLF